MGTNRRHLSSPSRGNTSHSRSRGNSGKSVNGKHGGKSSKAGLYILLTIAGIAVIGGLVWLLTRSQGDDMDMSRIDEFAHKQLANPYYLKQDGKDAYIDFSDGMQWAYMDAGVKQNLEAVTQKLTKYSDFFSLANEQITPMGKQNSKDIYNRIISQDSYNNTSAPLEKALQRIVKEGRPAFLITDFEEYENSQIQLEAWAKKYFIDWINKGNSIIFYVMDYEENGKQKHLYFTVFDGGQYALLKDVEDALAGRANNFTRFHLANDVFPMARNYHKDIIGGNYHELNADGTPGMDNVTVVDEKGTPTSYHVIDGYLAEYYPMLAGSWATVIENAKALSVDGVPDNQKFTHLLSDRFVNLNYNSGYDINELELVVTDVTDQFKAFEEGGEMPQPKVIRDMFTLATPLVQDSRAHLIAIDLDPKFNGKFPDQDRDDKALYRLDVNVHKATPKYDLVNKLFSWSGNNSLAESVRNALQSTNPGAIDSPTGQGKRLITFYLKML